MVRRHVISRVTFTALAFTAFGLVGCADAEPTGEGDESVVAEQAVQRSISATLTVSSAWADGYCASVVVKNTSPVTLKAWAIILGIHPSGISTIWNAEPVIVGVEEYKQLVARSMPYNSALAPNESTEFGFCGLGASTGSIPNVVSAQGFD
jgi:cellulase/cellobiase CelA1